MDRPDQRTSTIIYREGDGELGNRESREGEGKGEGVTRLSTYLGQSSPFQEWSGRPRRYNRPLFHQHDVLKAGEGRRTVLVHRVAPPVHIDLGKTKDEEKHKSAESSTDFEGGREDVVVL